MSRKLKIIIVDDHPLVRESMTLFLAREPDFDIVGSCANADEAMLAVNELSPDVVLMDIEMPGTVPFVAARELRRRGSNARFVFLSAFLTDTYIQDVLDLAPSGYLVKSANVQAIADAIRTVNAGRNAFGPEVAGRLPTANECSRRGTVSRLALLTAREREVLRLVANDLSGKEIASELALSSRTVDRHKANIMEKLNIHTQVGLTRFAMAEGVCDPRVFSPHA